MACELTPEQAAENRKIGICFETDDYSNLHNPWLFYIGIPRRASLFVRFFPLSSISPLPKLVMDALFTFPPCRVSPPLGASQAREFQKSNIHARYPSKTLSFTVIFAMFSKQERLNGHVFAR